MKPLIAVRRILPVFTLLALFALWGPVAGLGQERSLPPASSVQETDPDLAQKLTLAEGHHDLAVLYIKKGELDLAVAEARQIMQIRFPADYEKLVAESLSIITERLAEIRRFDLCQKLLDDAWKVTEQNANRVLLLKNKARLFMLSGDNDKAIESWRRALDLETRRGR
jgi:tetratricopeptide (TPR) repeat protein